MRRLRQTCWAMVIAVSVSIPLCSLGRFAFAAEGQPSPVRVTRIAAEEPGHGLSTAEVFIAVGTMWLAAATTLLWIATHKLHAGAEKASATTATQVAQQIQAAVASNEALRAVADATKNNAVLMSELMSKQFRSYMVADFGRGFYQDKYFSFGAEAVIRNRGLTPAHNVSFWLSAKVMKGDAIDLAMPVGTTVAKNDATIAPTQEYVIRRSVDHRFSDDEVNEILEGVKQKLFLYGEILYEDIYGKSHITKFCHTFFFTKAIDKDGKDIGYNYHPLLHPTHNTAS